MSQNPVLSRPARSSYRAKISNCIQSLEYRELKDQVQFIAAAVRHRRVFRKLTEPEAGSAFERLINDRPQYASLLMAPYIDSRWSNAERVDRLMSHAASLQGQLGKYDFSVRQSLHLLDLTEWAITDYHIVLDKPLWFSHEGLITLNIFSGNFRFFSITFSFVDDDGWTGVIIGGVQGRNTTDILAQYRDFTKLTNGLRPRDFLFEILRIIARAENVSEIHGIPDQFRYHRHSYFTMKNGRDLYLDYDEIWQDRGGVLNQDGVYTIPLTADRRLGRVASKKRAMYRRRFELLDRIEARITANLKTAIPVAGGHAR